MGDSSVSCSLSGLVIHGEPAIFMPLVPPSYVEPITGAIVSGGYNNMVFPLFQPLTIPYEIEVDDYGRFDHIPANANTDAISRAFEMSIEEFTLKCIQGDPVREWITGAGCFIQKDIYDRFSQPISGNKVSGSLWLSTFAGRNHLEAIGCEFVGKGSDDRFCEVFRHPKIEGVQFETDGRYSRMYTDADGKEVQGHGLEDFHNAMTRLGYAGFPGEDIERVKVLSSVQFALLDEIKELSRKIDLEQRMRKALGQDEIVYFTICDCPTLRGLLAQDLDLLREYWLSWQTGGLLEELEQLYYLLNAFKYSNRLLMPTICTTQYPEHTISLLIANGIQEVALKRQQDYASNR